MCKPSRCCNPKSADAVGIVAMVVIALAILGAVGPIVAAISHVIIEVIKLVAIGVASGAMIAAVAWVTVQVMRARAINRPAPRNYVTVWEEPARISRAQIAIDEQSCITCGDTGRIIRIIGNGDSFQIRACPECQPAQLTR
jgi:hypothetical protein